MVKKKKNNNNTRTASDHRRQGCLNNEKQRIIITSKDVEADESLHKDYILSVCGLASFS